MTATRTLDPDEATLQVLTFRDGVAQKVGHDLVLVVERWSASVTTSGDGAVEAVTAEADSGSLRVVEGRNGLKPLSDKDRRDIKGSIDEKVLRRQPITFSSTSVQARDGGLRIEGELSIGGERRPVTLALDVADDRVRGTLALTQSAWNIKPYKALMGALKVRDEVQITIDAPLPAG